MDYEKKYKEALENARQEYNATENVGRKQWLEELFPELAESEDEEIRKEIVKVFKSLWDCKIPSPINYADIFTWLEKQGEQKPCSWKPTEEQFEALDYAYNSCSDTERGNYYEGVLGTLIEDLHRLEKQGEQKPADKVEPKFKAGDWVVTDKNNTVQIKAVNNGYYTIDNGMDFNSSYVDRCWHLWTIEDAKDGDVLSNGKMIVIFKHFEEPSYRQHIVAYIGLDIGGDIQITDGTWLLGIDKTKPATKEQRELLFQKMKEAGYEWDAEKKELEEIEQKPAEWKQENVEELTKFENAMMHIGGSFFGENAGLDPNDTDTIKEQAELLLELAPKTEWSEEDERIYKVILEILNSWSDGTIGSYIISSNTDRYINWFKSIKNKVQPKPAWSEEDEVKINRIVAFLKNLNVADNDILLKDADWLKSLKQRIGGISYESDAR